MHYAKTLLKTFSLSLLLSSCSTSAFEDPRVKYVVGAVVALGAVAYRLQSCRGRARRALLDHDFRNWWSGNTRVEKHCKNDSKVDEAIKTQRTKFWNDVLSVKREGMSNADHVERLKNTFVGAEAGILKAAREPIRDKEVGELRKLLGKYQGLTGERAMEGLCTEFQDSINCNKPLDREAIHTRYRSFLSAGPHGVYIANIMQHKLHQVLQERERESKERAESRELQEQCAGLRELQKRAESRELQKLHAGLQELQKQVQELSQLICSNGGRSQKSKRSQQGSHSSQDLSPLTSPSSLPASSGVPVGPDNGTPQRGQLELSSTSVVPAASDSADPKPIDKSAPTPATPPNGQKNDVTNIDTDGVGNGSTSQQ